MKTCVNSAAILIAILIFASCAKSRVEITIHPGTPNWKAAKELSYVYQRSKNHADRLTIAEKGILYSEECIKETPSDPACYYYRAINTGLYYQSKVIGYQDGLRSMISDCEKVIALDSHYEYGGGYRILALIYLEAPPTSLKQGAVIRDTDKAKAYIEEALSIAPDYPENHLVFSKAYLKDGNAALAQEALKKVKSLMPTWHNHEDYAYWKDEVRQISKKLKRLGM